MKNVVLFIAVLLLFGCKRKPLFIEMGNKDFFIQVSQEKNKSDDSATEYKIRLFSNVKDMNIKKKMMYAMDSCFYQIQNNSNQYPDVVIPVASGIKDCFEYLVVFPAAKGKEPNNNTLIYQDKYINGKRFQLTLK